ncbi:unnamed protein product [Agarophyton chilense]
MANKSSSTWFMTSSINHPRLADLDSKSVRLFLRSYDQYSLEIKKRAEQLQLNSAVSTKSVRPVSLKFCVDIELVESSLTLGLITDGPDNYEDMSYNHV